MTVVRTVAAAFYCMPPTGCAGETFILPLYAPQWERIAREVQCVSSKAGGAVRFACYRVCVNRSGVAFDLLSTHGGFQAARFVLEDWALAWDQLGIDVDAEFSGHDAIEAYGRVRAKIGNRTIVRKRGQHGRKTNASKGNSVSGDLEERCHFESVVHCRPDGESLYGAAKRALETTPREMLPRSLIARMEAVRHDAGQSYSGKHQIRDVIKDVLRNVRHIEQRNGDCRRY